MAKRDKSEEEVVEEVAEVSATPAPPVVPVVLISAPRNKVYSLEQWAQIRKKPARHLAGMRAFLRGDAGNKFPLELWDAKMAAY